MILRHGNRSRIQFIGGIVGLIGFAFEDVGISAVGLLNFAHHDGLEFATGVFQVVVRLGY